MKYLFLSILSLSLFAFTLAPSSDLETSECYAAFDILQETVINDKDNKIPTQTISIEKLLSFKQVTYSLNSCTGEREDVQEVSSYRFIKVPAEGPASMYASSGGSFSENMITAISALQAGDRAIFEAIKIVKDGENILLKPVVFTIE